ncbi:hypothetical protein GC170_21975 [bacterium]|nr:hypothetical protein [bacterium]
MTPLTATIAQIPMSPAIARYGSALLWLLAWVIAAVWTRRSRWSTDRWLDLALSLQTASVCVVITAQVTGAFEAMRWTLPWLPPLLFAIVKHRWAKVSPGELTTASDPPGSGVSWLALLAVSTVILTFGRLFPASLLGAVKVVSDAPIYHLYFAAKWWLAGSISWIPIPFGENAAPYFPANGDLWFTYLVGWTNDLTLAKVGQVPFWFFAGYLIVCLCRTLGASVSSGIIAASIWMTLSPLALFTFEANVDTIFAAWFLASVYFYVEYDLRRPRDTASDESGSQASSVVPIDTPAIGCFLLVQSLLAAGLAWGTKAPGLVFVPPWVAYVTIRELRQRRAGAVRSIPLQISAIWAVTVLPVAFWWVRNVLATGNPLYPLPVEFGGITLAEGWYGPDVMRLSPYYIPFQEWRAGADQLLAVTDPRVLPVVLIAMIWWGGRFMKPLSARDRWTGVLAIAGLCTIAAFWFLIPYRTQQRFFLHGLALFAPVTALCMDRFRAYKALGVTSLCLHAFTTQGWPFATMGNEPPWDFSPSIPNAVPALVPFADVLARLLMVDTKTIGLLLLTFGCIVCWRFRAVAKNRAGFFASALAVTGFALLLIGEQRGFERSGRGQRFPVFPDYERAWNAFESITKSSPKRVAYSGTNLAIYLMGPNLANWVEYVNVNDHGDFMPHDYHLALPPDNRRWTDPRPTWERLETDYDAWLKNLRSKGIELVVVARANPNEGQANPHDRQGFPIERSWMDAHPQQFRPVYGARENDREMRIYEVLK